MPDSSRHEFDIPVQFVAELNPVRILTDETAELSPELREAILKGIMGTGDAQRAAACRGTLAIEFKPMHVDSRLSREALATVTRETAAFLDVPSSPDDYRIHTSSINSPNATCALIIKWEFYPPHATVSPCHAEGSVVDEGGEESSMMEEGRTPRRLPIPEKATPEDLEIMDMLAASAANRTRFDGAFMEQFGGELVAWNADGTRIVAHAPTNALLYEKIERTGVNVSQCRIEYVPSEHDEEI